MPTNKQSREVTRQQLQRQLERRRADEARRRKTTLITSIAVTILLIAGVITAVAVAASGSDSSKSTSGSATAQSCTAPGGSTVTYHGVTVQGATDLKSAPKVTSSSSSTPTFLECQDLVVGTGPAATPTSTVKVQYAGVLYKNGTAFDSSWSNGGTPAQFSLTGVVPGFTQGIGGNGTVAPMKVGGRRLMILPASLGYGAQANGKIPANSALVFVVDLTSVS